MKNLKFRRLTNCSLAIVEAGALLAFVRPRAISDEGEVLIEVFDPDDQLVQQITFRTASRETTVHDPISKGMEWITDESSQIVVRALDLLKTGVKTGQILSTPVEVTKPEGTASTAVILTNPLFAPSPDRK